MRARPWRFWARFWAIPALIVMVIGVLPLGATFLVGRQASDAVRTQARGSLSSTTSLTAQLLGEHLGGLEELAVSYAGRPALRNAVRSRGRSDVHELRHQMTALQHARPDVLSAAGIVDLSGAMLASTLRQLPDASFSHRDWFQEVVRTGRPYVSQAFAGRPPGSPLVVNIAVPVRDSDDRISAIVVMDYPLARLQSYVARFAQVGDVHLFVTDQVGALIAQPGTTVTSLSTRTDDHRVRAALSGWTGTTEDEVDASGAGLLSAHSPVPHAGWAVVGDVPQSRAYAEVQLLPNGVGPAAVPLAILLLVGSMLLARAFRSRDDARRRAERLVSINSAVLDASREGITVADAQGTPIMHNATMRTLVGGNARTDANVYAEMRRLATGTSDPDRFAALAAELESDPDLVQAIDYTLASFNRSFHLYSRPVTDNGGPVGRLFVVRETTAERQVRAAVQEAKDEADRANEAKSGFLSRMSHELRTPLNAILGFTQLLKRDDLPGEAGARVEQIDHAGRLLLALINEVLDISRIEAGQVALSPEPVQLCDLVAETCPLVSGLAESANVTLDVSVPDDHWAQVDRQRLEQVLVNLLTNAIKYNRPGGRVSVVSSLVEGSLQVRVHDTGHGIPEGRLDDVFVPFDRLGADLSDVEGTGLGLSLSRALAEALGGHLTLESTSPQGSTFLLELIATEPWTGEARSPEHRSLPAAGPVDSPEPAGSTHAHTILYIEDNAANVALVEAILRPRTNLAVVACADGARGLEHARRDPPSMILLDLHLPGLSGKDVLVALKSDPRTADVPVVILTADIMTADPPQLLGLGARDFVTKPVDVVTLQSLVDAILIERETT